MTDMEFKRTCAICGCELLDGFTDGDAYVCEEHFDEYMNRQFGIWRNNDHEGEEHWCGGYYDWYDPREDRWHDTEFYWTEWYE